ncbi:hypothetical protein QYF36_001186 [Acer negundo]|nr:hypothetical protein QYF36_001186 [Acer negundo]
MPIDQLYKHNDQQYELVHVSPLLSGNTRDLYQPIQHEYRLKGPQRRQYGQAEQGISHARRSSEYHDRNAQYYRIQEDMGMRKVHIYEFSRLNMVYTLLSKRNLLWFVQNGKVDGWDDPRFPTIQGIVRRGLKVEALIQFILEQGASKNLNLMEWDKLWTINKKIIDSVCPRHTTVIEERRVLLTLTNGPDEPFVRIMPRHKKYEGAGEKETTFTKRIWLDHEDAKSVSVLKGLGTRFESAALGDPNIRNLKPGEVLQLERKGYFICDVPDGRQQAILK